MLRQLSMLTLYEPGLLHFSKKTPVGRTAHVCFHVAKPLLQVIWL